MKKNITKVILKRTKKKVWNYKNVVIEKNLQEKIVNGIIKIIHFFFLIEVHRFISYSFSSSIYCVLKFLL